MAIHQGIPGGAYRLWTYAQDVGSPGAVPGTVAKLCSAFNMNFSGDKALTDTVSPDCADFTAPGWSTRTITANSATISADGDVEAAELAALMAFFTSNERVPLMMVGHAVDNQQANTINKYQTIMAFWHLSNVTVTGQRDALSTISLGLSSDGEVKINHNDAAGLAEQFHTAFAH